MSLPTLDQATRRQLQPAPITSADVREIPTLILSGAYDNLTPVSWNKSAFATLPNGVFVLAPGAAHGVITYSACADRIAQAFITDPALSPDISCLATLEPKWVLPPAAEMPSGEPSTPAAAVAGSRIRREPA